MKIVLIGAGSYVFGPTVLRDAIERNRLDGWELCLVDTNAEAADLMAVIGRRMAAELAVDIRVSSSVDRRAALPGADFVILSAAPQGARRWQMDYEILCRAGMPDQARECGGLGGLANALRSIGLALDVCRDMERLCPKALLLDVTNPMPRVVTAVNRFTRIRCYGFCNVAQGAEHGYGNVAAWLGRAAEDIGVVSAGLNHFAWLVSVRERGTGKDLYGEVVRAIQAGTGRDFRVLQRWLARFGGIALSGIDHPAEYLPCDPDIHYHTTPPYHGDAAEREHRRQELLRVASGEADWHTACAHGSWEHPIDVAAALGTGDPLDVPILNLPNQGCVDEIPAGRIVEAPARVENGAVRGVSVGRLPGQVAAICRQVSDVHEWVAEGAATRSRAALLAAIEADPAITQKAAAVPALDALLAAHADLVPGFK